MVVLVEMSGSLTVVRHDTWTITRIHTYISPPPPGRQVITIEDRRRLWIKYVGSVRVVFHGYTDERTILVVVSYVSGLSFNPYSLYARGRSMTRKVRNSLRYLKHRLLVHCLLPLGIVRISLDGIRAREMDCVAAPIPLCKHTGADNTVGKRGSVMLVPSRPFYQSIDR